MGASYGSDDLLDDASLVAAALVRARAAAGSAVAATEVQVGLLDAYVERFGAEGCRVLVAVLTELLVTQAGDVEGLLAGLEELELGVLTEAQRRER
ncbi:hypothetical protein OHV05_34170 [Kitasatospora sp. NBC_00070]|uniref:hypothetical protein n=1 Tax=Kitasatospora sp. NBC_00070 TaxID=2975962 RepID=UPI00324EA521